jgi:hypothetical protein
MSPFTNPNPIYITPLNHDILMSEVVGLDSALNLDHYIAKLQK